MNEDKKRRFVDNFLFIMSKLADKILTEMMQKY